MLLFLTCFAAGGSFLFSFLLFFHPLHHNERANRWLGLFVLTVGAAFVAIYLKNTLLEKDHVVLSACINALRFLTGPLLYLSIQFFVQPARVFKRSDLLHFIPFAAYSLLRFIFIINSRNTTIHYLPQLNGLPAEAYFLPVQTMVYTLLSYKGLLQHRANLKLVTAAINETDLSWLRSFLLIFMVDILLWINEIFLDISWIVKMDPFIYTGSLYFLAHFSIKQKPVFSFRKKDLGEIAAVFDEAQQQGKRKPVSKRLSGNQLLTLTAQLNTLILQDKIYLDNDLNLPELAQKLGISIHDTSFLINEVTGQNFYNYINKHRVEEAKKLLLSDKTAELNMLGIAFAAGFNSKTTFNTTFKKLTGMSPTRFIKNIKKD